MMKITKLLSLESVPAPTLLARADKIVLTFDQRVQAPATFTTVAGAELENALGETRPLEVDDVLVDERGRFYVVKAGVETILKVTGDMDLMQQAVYALTARGIRVAQAEGGFALPLNDQLKSLLENVGLTVTPAEAPFEPVPLPRHHGGCGCGCGGHHHHHHDGECGCGHHHHDHEEGECCCGHHHDGDEECGCGHHHHDHEEGECCCGHHHGEGEECGCGHHHHDHEEGECCCGHDHNHEHEHHNH
ncbi:MAG: hypothetical protein IJ164_08455 [Duodenibacillus sp.]|nr:hypothetical protein [Duodenibacillus sp.]